MIFERSYNCVSYSGRKTK